MPDETPTPPITPAIDPKTLPRRLGRFRISDTVIREHPLEAMKVMAECLVIRCECMYSTRTFDYIAVSPHFAEIPNGAYAPDYEAVMESVNIGTDEESNWITRFKGFSPVGSKQPRWE